jgi:hypothetical protein
MRQSSRTPTWLPPGAGGGVAGMIVAGTVALFISGAVALVMPAALWLFGWRRSRSRAGSTKRSGLSMPISLSRPIGWSPCISLGASPTRRAQWKRQLLPTERNFHEGLTREHPGIGLSDRRFGFIIAAALALLGVAKLLTCRSAVPWLAAPPLFAAFAMLALSSY